MGCLRNAWGFILCIHLGAQRKHSELGGRGMNLPGVTVEVTQIAALLKERVCNGAVLHDTRGDTAVAFSFSLAKVSLQKKTISRIALF